MNKKYFDFYAAIERLSICLKNKSLPVRKAEEMAARIISFKRRAERLQREIERLSLDL